MSDEVQMPLFWSRRGWTATIVENLDGDGGWAVEMKRDGDPEPALVGPWTMGRDKKSPKPLDRAAFDILVKTATDVLVRHENQSRAGAHRHLVVPTADGRRVYATWDAAGDEDDPHGIVACVDERTGERLREGRVPAGFKLTAAAIERFLTGDDDE